MGIHRIKAPSAREEHLNVKNLQRKPTDSMAEVYRKAKLRAVDLVFNSHNEQTAHRAFELYVSFSEKEEKCRIDDLEKEMDMRKVRTIEDAIKLVEDTIKQIKR